MPSGEIRKVVLAEFLKKDSNGNTAARLLLHEAKYRSVNNKLKLLKNNFILSPVRPFANFKK